MIELIEKLRSFLSEKELQEQEPMNRHTTFRVGGPARVFLMPETEEKLVKAVALCREAGVLLYVIGHGSNLLALDAGYPGVILCTEALKEITVNGTVISAQAGAMLSVLARKAMEEGLTGLEFAAGIPGTLGGAVMMNAGAYGSEMKAVLTGARVLTKDGEIRERSLEELKLGYRSSSVAENGDLVLSAEMQLMPGDPKAILAQMEELGEKRREKQPLEYPSAGSTFKRPEGYFAGKLIDDAGLRGFRVGGAQISEKHCGFVINREKATAADILELCRQTAECVKGKFGVDLEMEIRILQ